MTRIIFERSDSYNDFKTLTEVLPDNNKKRSLRKLDPEDFFSST